MIQTRCTLYALALAAWAMIGLSNSADALEINDFDSGVEGWRFDFGGAGTVSHDPTEGSPGNAQGALKLEMDFNLDTIAFTGDVFGTPMDLTGDPELLFDLKIDPNSARDAFGNHGYMNFVSRETNNYDWGSQPGRNLAPAMGWTTFSVSTTDGLTMAQTRALTFQLYGGASQNITGNVTVWLDNIRTVPEPGAAGMALITLLGWLPLSRLGIRK